LDALKNISATDLSVSIPHLHSITPEPVVPGVATFALVPSAISPKNELPFQLHTREDGTRTAILLEQPESVPGKEMMPAPRRSPRQTIPPNLGWIKAALAVGAVATGALSFLTLSSLSNSVDARIPVIHTATAVPLPPAMAVPSNAISVPPPQENPPVTTLASATSANSPSDLASVDAREPPSASATGTNDVRKPAPKKVFIKPR